MRYVTTYRDKGKSQRTYVFSLNADGQLRVKHWTGRAWSKWADHGSPGTSIASQWIGVITYFDDKRRIHAFCEGYPHNGLPSLHVYQRYLDGRVWKWADQSSPPGSQPKHGPSVISYPRGGQQRIYVFLTDVIPPVKLYVQKWDGTQWGEWTDHGTPSGLTVLASPPEAITYGGRGIDQRISCFVVGENGHLFRNYWNGTGTLWRWADHGKLSDTTAGAQAGAIAYVVRGKPRIHAFVAGKNGHLYRNWFNGTRWQWADQGTPRGTTVVGSPAVITYFRTRRIRRFGLVRQTYIHAFSRGADRHLYSNIFDGRQWSWFDHATPPHTEVATGLAAVTYSEGGKQRIHVFCYGLNGHVFVNHRIGTSWKWTDLGKP